MVPDSLRPLERWVERRQLKTNFPGGQEDWKTIMGRPGDRVTPLSLGELILWERKKGSQ